IVDSFDVLSIIRRDGWVNDTTGQQSNPADVGVLREGLCQLQHIQCLPAGVCIAPKLWIPEADQAMDAQHDDIQPFCLWFHDVILTVWEQEPITGPYRFCSPQTIRKQELIADLRSTSLLEA